MAKVILEVTDVSKHFGGLAALNQVNFTVKEGEIRGLVGPNGAGKTTLFNVISGFLRPSRGKIKFNGKEITGLRPDAIAKLGLARTFQMTTLFTDMTVQQNVSLGFYSHIKSNLLSPLFRTSFYMREEEEIRQKTFELLMNLGIEDFKDELAGNLPHGFQRALAIASALSTRPMLVLLDEPIIGLNPKETSIMVDRIKKIRDRMGLTFVIIEHEMRTMLRFYEKITVLNHGEKLFEGDPIEMTKDKNVIEAYLGREMEI